ncbi:hypothetical protein CVT25_000994 [Psilocybe cyanescens]|uniref:PPM-type phosphatase domain-containing protein n=1 Tax=Psilocybe cyanescens TaxID=93625 RepID=A0A409XMH8_PSICY|nr:hypothetical protein CVT25_000994 [Psilocybe cyanescens]
MLRNCTRARPVLCKAFYSSSSRRKACQISGHEAAALLFVGGTAVFALANRVKKRDEAGEPDMINFDLGKFRNMCNGSVQVDRATFFLNGSRTIESMETEFTFSPTLKFVCFTIAEGFNEQGAVLAERLSKLLPEAVCSWFADLYSAAANAEPPSSRRNPGELPNPVVAPSSIDETIKKAFYDVDDQIITLDPTLRDADATLKAAATMGCSVLMGIYNAEDRRLRVALTGEGRAVLGRRVDGPDGRYMYQVKPLTADQVVTSPEEAARLTAAHPNEPNLLNDGRLLGLKQTRAFGVGAMKWSREVLHEDFGPDESSDDCLTPPYFTAVPAVTVTNVQPGDVAVFGTGGLWEYLRNEEAVGLVGLWIEQNTNNVVMASNSRAYNFSDLPMLCEGTTIARITSFTCGNSGPAVHLAASALSKAPKDS